MRRRGLRAVLAACLVLAGAPAAARAETFTVTTAATSPPGESCDLGSSTCTLREAITRANATVQPDEIHFDIGSGPQTIALGVGAGVPAISSPIRIDGTTQPGYDPATRVPMIELTGQAGAYLLLFAADGSGEVRGLALEGPAFAGVAVDAGAGEVTIAGNHIGIDRTGDALPADRLDNGVLLGGDLTTVGGATAADRNVIAGTGGPMVNLTFGATNNTIQGNYIGLDRTGAFAMDPSDSAAGVTVDCLANDTHVLDNAISGTAVAVQAFGGFCTVPLTGLVVSRNLLGLNAAGTSALHNATGISLTGRVANAELSSNRIAASRFGAIGLDGNGGPFVQDVLVKGNRLGPGPGDPVTFANVGSGISVFRAARVAIEDNTITGQRPVGFEPGRGIVLGSETSAIRLTRNLISASTGLGIDAGNDGPTANDAPDADGVQNFPVIRSAETDGTQTRARVTLASQSNHTYDVELFASPACDDSGNGEGATYLATQRVTTDGSAGADVALTLPAEPVGTVLTATATDVADASTSEFSTCRSVDAGAVFNANISVTTARTPAQPVLGQPLTYRFTVRNGGPAAATRAHLQVNLPDSLAVGGVSADQGSCAVAAPTVTCQLGTLGAGQAVAVTVSGTPTAAGPATASALAAADQVDPATADNEAADTATVASTAPPTATPAPTPQPTAVPAQATPTPTPTPSPVPPPVVGQSVDVAPVSGTVLVKGPGDRAFRPLRAGEQVPVGTAIDVTNGRIRLTSAADAAGRTQTSDFYGGRFRVAQAKAAKPVTELRLDSGSRAACGGAARAAASQTGKKKKRKTKTLNQLWGDGAGSFRTRGSYGTAAIRGTRWLTADRCDGTLFRVAQGVVSVRDFTNRKTVLVRAPRTYLAPARRAR